MKTKWLAQYLKNEDMYYLVELHEHEGVLGEHFFDTYKEYTKYVKENNILVKFSEND